MSDSDIILAEEKCYQWLTDKINNHVPADEEFELIKASMEGLWISGNQDLPGKELRVFDKSSQ